MTIRDTAATPSASIASRIAAAQNKCTQATKPAAVDVFERVGNPGDDGAALGTAGCSAFNPTVWVGATVSGILAEIGSLLGLVTMAVCSPCEGTTTTQAAKD